MSDIVISFYLTIMLWYIYHVIATRPAIRKESRLIYWLEKDLALWEERHPQDIDPKLQAHCSC